MVDKIKTFILIREEKEPERLKKIKSQILNLNLNEYLDIHFFNYCWKEDITEQVRNKYCKSDWTMKKHNRNMIDHPLTQGEISLFLNYIFCLKRIRDTYTEGNFLILESDAIFTDNFNKETIKQTINDMNLIEELDILNIGEGVPNYFYGYPKTKPTIVNNNKYYRENLNRCTEANLWKYIAVCKFLDYFEENKDIDGPIDTKMDVLATDLGGFNIFWPEKYMIRQGSHLKIFNSTLR